MDAEIVVVGAGVAGAAAAAAAARAGRDVLLVAPPGDRRPEHGETLPPQARGLLLDLAAWDAFAAVGNRPCRAHRSVWGGRLRTWERLFDPHGHGWYVHRRQLEAGLRDTAVEAGARLRSASVQQVAPTGRQLGLTLDDGETIRAGWVVDATGRRAAVARRLGARRVPRDRLVGLCRRHPGDPDPATLVEAVADGWWFSAPTGTGLITIRFGDADLTDWRRAARDYPQLLGPAPHTRARVAAAGPADRSTLVAASTSVLRPITGARWVAVGDAAATYDPLSSDGLLHGLRTGRAAVAAIVGDDLPTYDRLERKRFDEHLRQRRAHYDVERRWPDAEFWRRRHVREAEAAGRGR